MKLSNERNGLITACFLAMLLFANYFFQNDYISLMCTCCVSIYFLVCHERLLVPHMLFYSSFAYLFRFSGYAIYVLICLTFIFRCIISNKKSIVIWLFLAVFYYPTHIIMNDFSKLTLGQVFPFIINITLFYMCYEYSVGEADKKECFLFFICGHILSSVLSLAKAGSRITDVLAEDYVTSQKWWDTVRFSGVSYDANFYALEALLVICILLFMYKNKMNGITWLFLLWASIIFGALTYSKSYYFCLGVILIMVVVNSEKQIRRRFYKLIPFAVIVCAVFWGQIESVLHTFLNRFTSSETLNTVTTGRFDLWTEYMQGMFDSFSTVLLGHGITTYGLSTTRGVLAAHNTYIEIFYKFGLIGMFFDFAYLVICKRCFNMNREMVKSLQFNDIIIVGLFLILIFNLSAFTFYGISSSVFIVWLMTTRERNEVMV